MIEAFPQVSFRSFSVREKGQAKAAARTWNGTAPIDELVTWAVLNWTAIMGKQFAWMTKTPAPATPAWSFFARFLTDFADCMAEGKLADWQSAPERTEIERVMARGMSYEQATNKLASDTAAAKLRDEMSQRESIASARERSAEAKLNQARVLAETEGRVPVHPRSRAAQRLRAKTTRTYGPDDDEFKPLGFPMVDPNRNPFDE